MKPVFLICLLALIAVAFTPLRAGKLVAIVEESDGDTGDAQLFDMLEGGQIITFGSGERLVLGDLRSCWRETITGGVVTVGAEHGKVEPGRVFCELVECNGGSLILTDSQL